MKRILCITLALLLSFNNVYIAYAEDHTSSSGEDHGGSSGTFEDYGDLPVNYKPPTEEQQRFFDILANIVAPEAFLVKQIGLAAYDALKSSFKEKNEDSIKEAMQEDGAISRDKNYFYINQNLIKNVNQKFQDSIHALDGYWLVEPDSTYTPQWFTTQGYLASSWKQEELDNFLSLSSSYPLYCAKVGSSLGYYYYGIMSDDIYFYYKSDYSQIAAKIPSGKSDIVHRWCSALSSSRSDRSLGESSYISISDIKSYSDILSKFVAYCYGAPFKIFYSEEDLNNYLNKGRTYVPKLPSGGIKIPITYINNNTTLPDFNINLDSLVGKAEADIQADIDLALKNYLDKLADVNINPPTDPTPTPSHGGSSGDFGDGTTPTPKPDFSDGSLTDTNTLLQKILDKLTEFDSSHDKLAKTITDYIEKNNGKLDEIIQAIDKISQGDTEGEENGCKYDYTELSDFMTSIWNESDKKFDKMVELLEENNEYQKKLVRSLNEIKAILITQTVLELFQDRSQQAANQAKEKFPTSIPWDIAMVLNAMAAEPKELKFELPIKVESFHINESISVDLTADEWEKLAKTCRYLLSVTFILYLIHLSRKLFIKGDDD